MDYKKRFEPRWSDLDPNGHLRGSVYLDFTDQTRISYFEKHGQGFAAWRKYGIGPIILEQQLKYTSEVKPGDLIDVTLEVLSISEDRRFCRVRHRILKAEGTQQAAEVELLLSFMDLKARKIVPCPEEIVGVYADLIKNEGEATS